MSILDCSKEVLGESEFDVVSAAGNLLFADTSVRPTPHNMADLISQGLTEAQILAAGSQHGLELPVMDETLAELDVSLPYFHMLSDKLALDHPDEVLLFAGRDAEVLHDDFALTHSNHLGHLMPASTGLWHSPGMSNNRLATEFLTGFGLSGSEISDVNNKFVVVDSGFYGSIGLFLGRRVFGLHGLSLNDRGQLKIKLVSAASDAIGTQIIDLETCRNFPQLNRALQATSKTGNAYALAVEMQLMPRFHGAFANLEERAGNVVAYSKPSPIYTDIDTTGHNINASIVNPLAAAIAQYRVVSAAMEREVKVERKPLGRKVITAIGTTILKAC